jgi:D-alanyl-lipoteichoic acid acyltransferase DltB (MBOAT superfamily)
VLFNSLEYAVFLLFVVGVYFALPFRLRVWFLLAASYYFYMRWRWEFIFLIVAQTFVTFEAARRIAHAKSEIVRRFWLSTSIVFCLGLLGYFKYLNFFQDALRPMFEVAGLSYLAPHLDIILPVGISFYTFQALSYTIDVYRGAHVAEPYLARYALYVAFFPQLVAGPIERATHLLDQFSRRNRFDIERFIDGGKLIVWGLFKKVVIADRLAIYVDRVYESPELYSGPTLLMATYFFAFQIYCDFSGYSDIAIGSARILGYDLMQNFRVPYMARSISDFWRRWHISLTSWFRTYLYLPLGGSRVGYLKWARNILAVFLISGLWHGANWTFIVWGGLHATYYFAESGTRRIAVRSGVRTVLPGYLIDALRILLTFHLVLLSWVFFRASSVADAGLILTKIFTDFGGAIYMGASQLTTLLSIALIGVLVAVQVMQEKGFVSLYFSKSRIPAAFRWPLYAGMILCISTLGVSSNAFIYFQF